MAWAALLAWLCVLTTNLILNSGARWRNSCSCLLKELWGVFFVCFSRHISRINPANLESSSEIGPWGWHPTEVSPAISVSFEALVSKRHGSEYLGQHSSVKSPASWRGWGSLAWFSVESQHPLPTLLWGRSRSHLPLAERKCIPKPPKGLDPVSGRSLLEGSHSASLGLSFLI